MAQWIPGRDTLGRGFNPLEDTFTSTRTPIFQFDTARESREINGVTFDIPEGVNINAEQSSAIYTNIVKHSTAEMEEHIAGEAHVKANYGLFGGQVDAYYDHNTKRSTEFDLSLREFGMRLWELGIDFSATPRAEVVDAVKRFAAENKPDEQAIDRFFSTFGTHYVTAVAVGGRCSMCSSVSKSLQATEEVIKAQVELEYGAFIHASGGVDRSKMDQSYLENRQVKISVFGGNVALAGKFQSEEGHYAEWLDSVNREPDVVKQSLEAIWNLPGLDTAEVANLQWAFSDYCTRKSRYTLEIPTGEIAGVVMPSQIRLEDPSKGQGLFVEMWVRPETDNGSSEETLFQIEPLCMLRRKGKGIVYNNYEGFRLDDRAVCKNGDVPAGKWTHVAVSIWPSSSGQETHNIVDFYIMGRKTHQGRTRLTCNRWRAISQFFIGTRSLTVPSFALPGQIQEFRIWNLHRATMEIRERMFKRLIGNEPGLLVYMPLVEGGSGRKTFDKTDRGFTGTLAGDAGWARAEQPFGQSPMMLQHEPELIAAEGPAVPAEEAANWLQPEGHTG